MIKTIDFQYYAIKYPYKLPQTIAFRKFFKKIPEYLINGLYLKIIDNI